MKSVLILLLTSLLLGCGGARQGEVTEAVVTPYDAICLRNMWLGRGYAAQGRYELAKEHYLVALAASKDPETRNVISRELNSMDMIIKTER